MNQPAGGIAALRLVNQMGPVAMDLLSQSLQMQRVGPPTLGFAEVPKRHVHEAVGPELVCRG